MLFLQNLESVWRINCTLLRSFGTAKVNSAKVSVVGAAGAVGTILCTLLKLRPDLIAEIVMHDVSEMTPGVAMDLSHVCTAVKVKSYSGVYELRNALKGSDIVVMLAGVSKKPALTRESFFTANAGIIKEFAKICADICPDALINIVTNPINSCVPVFCEEMRRAKKLNPQKVFGVSTIDAVRASTFIAEMKNLDPAKVICPVVGGHSDLSIVPLLSQCKPPIQFTAEEIIHLTHVIQQAGMTATRAKKGTTPVIASAYSAARFVFSLLRARKGETNIVECSYTMNDNFGTKYFSSKLLLGKGGVEKDLGIGSISDFEEKRIDEAILEIKHHIAVAEKFMR